jgi:hypothetical protein
MKQCLYCAKKLTQRPREQNRDFQVRRFCGRACSGRAKVRTYPPRTCTVCGGHFRRRENELLHQFYARRYCSISCASTDRFAGNAPQEPRYCKMCGERLIRKRYGNRMEGWAQFKKRQYCDQICMADDFSYLGDFIRTAESAVAA